MIKAVAIGTLLGIIINYLILVPFFSFKCDAKYGDWVTNDFYPQNCFGIVDGIENNRLIVSIFCNFKLSKLDKISCDNITYLGKNKYEQESKKKETTY